MKGINSGVPQGSCLGPLLFLIYINDLPFALQKSHVSMYALIVDHGILLDKMKFYVICGLEHDWFRSYLNNRKQFCKVNGVLSDIKYIDVGVTQGSCLGPLLFLLYINDLPFALKKAETNMYADDTMISYASKTLDELHMVLNAELVDIEKWLQDNKLSLNVVKPQAMIVGPMQNVNKMAVQPTLLPALHVGGTDID